MKKLMSVAALFAAALIGSSPGIVWSDEASSDGSAAPAEQTPAPASGVVPGWNPPPGPGGYAQTWQQPPHWRTPQQGYGHFPPRYPTAPAAARENPLSAELKQTQEQLTAKSSKLDKAHSLLEQLRGKLQDKLAAEASLTDNLEYSTREQHALRVRVTELTETLNISNTTLEQQHQLINNHQAHNQQLTAERDQLYSELASQDEHLAALQSELQAATQALAQARSRAGTAGEALSAARIQIKSHCEALTRLEAELGRQEARLQDDPQSLTE